MTARKDFERAEREFAQRVRERVMDDVDGRADRMRDGTRWPADQVPAHCRGLREALR
jgi:hypothetical protein